jgi:hypothetical protein
VRVHFDPVSHRRGHFECESGDQARDDDLIRFVAPLVPALKSRAAEVDQLGRLRRCSASIRTCSASRPPTAITCRTDTAVAAFMHCDLGRTFTDHHTIALIGLGAQTVFDQPFNRMGRPATPLACLDALLVDGSSCRTRRRYVRKFAPRQADWLVVSVGCRRQAAKNQ